MLESGLVHKSGNVTFEQAAAVPTSGSIALHAVRTAGRLSPEHHVLVNGASGGVGMFSVLLAKAAGAQVTAVNRTDTLERLHSIGADMVIDYT